ncbi:MAG: L7Ae/L30e/S12e/Gadd45 family ribosomal protein [Christensenellales bacterium]|jgi:ribosomal protein L7Ae-like RNA K-turn-binding protein
MNVDSISKFLGMLGLCARAGRLTSGEDGVRIAVRKKQAALVIIDARASKGTREKAESLCKTHGTRLISADADIGKAIGKEGRRLIAVTDPSFAKNLLELFNIFSPPAKESRKTAPENINRNR